MTEADIEAGLRALERLRGTVDDAVLDLACSALIERLDALRAGLQPDRRLKQVSVLFVDTVGSTALSARFDPETLQAIFDTLLARYTQLVQRHGGRVLQYTGDGLLAAFGTDQTREDDAERAVLAGLAMITETARSAQAVREAHGIDGFQVRVGIHTGEVLLGGGVDGDNTIRGVTVSLAARMEQTAPPGGLRISQTTQRMVQGLFEMQPQAPIAVKGAAEPLATWLVERRLSRRLARRELGVRGVQTPLMGRAAELQALQASWRQLLAGTPPVQVSTLVADAGLGKTRLLNEWLAWSRQQADQLLWVAASARPASEHQPYDLLQALVHDLLQLPDAESPALARQAFANAVVARLPADERPEAQAHVLGYLLGMDFSGSPHVAGIVQEGAQIRSRAFHTLRQLLAGEAAGRPLVLLLEDLHWADAGSLQFLRETVRVWTGGALWLLATARPTLDEHDAAWQAIETQRLALQPLAAAQSGALVDALLQPLPQVPTELHRLLTARAAGNPYYMQELLQMLFDRGALQVVDAAPDSPAVWHWHPDRFDARQMPATLAGVLQARLDGLPAAERQALARAAVIGPEFDDAALLALDPAAGSQLAALVSRQLLVALQRDDAGVVQRHAFGHQLMQEAAYASLLKPERLRAHGQVAAWWRARAEGDGQADAWIPAADHHERAEQTDACGHSSLMAAEFLASRFAHAEVAHQASRGLRFTDALAHEARWRLLCARQRALRLLGDHEGQSQDLAAMQAVADATGSLVQRATVAVRHLGAEDERGESARAVQEAPAVLELARASGDPESELAAFYVQASALRRTGRHGRALAVAEEGLERARALGDDTKACSLATLMAAVETERGDLSASQRLLRQALLLSQSLGNQLQECTILGNLGCAALDMGDLLEAQSQLDAAQRLCHTLGRSGYEATLMLNLSAVQLAQGRLDQALQLAKQASDLAQTAGRSDTWAFGQISCAAACMVAGDAACAMAFYLAAHQRLTELALPHLAIEATAGMAACARRLGHATEALAHAEAVLAHLAQTGNLDGTERPMRIWATCVSVLRDANDKRAALVLAQAWQALAAQLEALPDDATRERLLAAHADSAEVLRMAQAQGLAPA